MSTLLTASSSRAPVIRREGSSAALRGRNKQPFFSSWYWANGTCNAEGDGRRLWGGGSLIVPLSRLIVQLCGLPRDMVIRIPVHLVFPQDTKGWTMSGARTMTVLWALIPCR